jgi:hypothetical protein
MRLEPYIYIGCEVLTAVVMNVAIFWDLALCSSYVNRRYGGTHSVEPPSARWFLARLSFDSEDGGDMFLLNVGLNVD